MTWLADLFRDLKERRASRAFYGVCDECRHDWREHHADRGCSECRYEIDHAEPDALNVVCAARAPGYGSP